MPVSTTVVRSRTLLALALVAFVGPACDADGGARGIGPSTGGGKGDNPGQTSAEGGTDTDDVPASDHRDAVLQCEDIAAHVREHLGEGRYDAIVDLERDRNDCLVTANDAVTERVTALLSATDDPYAGEVTRAWKSHRTTGASLCNVLAEGHPDATGEGLAAVAAACIAGAELDFGAVLDAYVDFGIAPFSIPGARDRYPSCYEAYDLALAAAATTTDEVIAHDALASCISDAHDDLLGELAARVVESFPGRDATTVELALRDAATAFGDARDKICIIATRSGPARGTETMDLDRAECAVDVAIQGGGLLDIAAPGLLPDGSFDPGDGSSSGGSGGGESSSSG